MQKRKTVARYGAVLFAALLVAFGPSAAFAQFKEPAPEQPAPDAPPPDMPDDDFAPPPEDTWED